MSASSRALALESLTLFMRRRHSSPDLVHPELLGAMTALGADVIDGEMSSSAAVAVADIGFVTCVRAGLMPEVTEAAREVALSWFDHYSEAANVPGAMREWLRDLEITSALTE